MLSHQAQWAEEGRRGIYVKLQKMDNGKKHKVHKQTTKANSHLISFIQQPEMCSCNSRNKALDINSKTFEGVFNQMGFIVPNTNTNVTLLSCDLKQMLERCTYLLLHFSSILSGTLYTYVGKILLYYIIRHTFHEFMQVFCTLH